MPIDSRRALGTHLNRSVQWEIARVRKAVAGKGMFWFVDIPRTSSTSLRACLGEAVGYPHGKENTLGQYSFARSGSVESSVIGSHVPVFLMRHILGGEIWDQCFKFSIIREPRDWLHSLFLYVCRYGNLGFKAKSFDAFLHEFLSFLDRPLEERVFPGRMTQSEYLLRDGSLDVNMIVDFSRRRSLYAHLNSVFSLNLNDNLALIQGRDGGRDALATSEVADVWNSIQDRELLLEIDRLLEPDSSLYRKCSAAQDGLLIVTGSFVVCPSQASQ